MRHTSLNRFSGGTGLRRRGGRQQGRSFYPLCLLRPLILQVPGGRIHAHSREQVEQLRLQQEKERKQALLSNGAMAISRLMQDEAIDATPRPDDHACRYSRTSIFLRRCPPRPMARRILKTAGLNDPHAPFHLLVKAGIWNPNENIPLLRQEIPLIFPRRQTAGRDAPAAGNR